MISDVRVFRCADEPFQFYGKGGGEAYLSRLIGPQDSTTMGAYGGRVARRSMARSGTSLNHEDVKSLVFMTVAPVDWRRRLKASAS